MKVYPTICVASCSRLALVRPDGTDVLEISSTDV